MGMDAELLAIGKYHPDVADALEYPAAFYSDTPEGSMIITHVASCVTSDGSKWLAESLGISPWQFQQHCDLSGDDVKTDLFMESVEDGENALLDFLKLRAYGFKFYYMPNG